MSTFLNALQGKNHSGEVPIWLMRQAGRYLPSYQQLKKNHRLIDLFHDADLVAEVTELPLRVLELDAAILFADLLSVLDSLGLKWDFPEGQGPCVESENILFQLPPLKPAKSAHAHIEKAIRSLKKTLKVPLIGFGGAPFSVACYVVEKKHGKDFVHTKQALYADPKRFHALLQLLTDATIDYLKLQVEAGVDALQLFDSWASLLPVSVYEKISFPYIKQIVEALRPTKIPLILFCRGSHLYLPFLKQLNPAGISIDWQIDLPPIRKQIPLPTALQGNLDPALLLASKEVISFETEKLLNQMGSDPGYIFNLGHGILPTTPFDHVKQLVDDVHHFNRVTA